MLPGRGRERLYMAPAEAVEVPKREIGKSAEVLSLNTVDFRWCGSRIFVKSVADGLPSIGSWRLRKSAADFDDVTECHTRERFFTS
jgi:hypothetical protein